MKYLFASAIAAALTLGSAHAADTPATAPAKSEMAQPAAAAKAGEPVAKDKKKPLPKKSGAEKPAATAAPAGAAPPAKRADPGLDAASARNRPATQTTPMMGTRGIPKAAPEMAGSKPADPPPAPAK